jgi:hypothetical protein
MKDKFLRGVIGVAAVGGDFADTVGGLGRRRGVMVRGGAPAAVASPFDESATNTGGRRHDHEMMTGIRG